MVTRMSAPIYRVSTHPSSAHLPPVRRAFSNSKYSSTPPDSHQKIEKIRQLKQVPRVHSQKELRNTREKEKKVLSFEEFMKKSKMDSFEEFSRSPYVIEVTRGNTEEMKRAYESYCQSKYLSYRQKLYGGNPATMI